MLGTNTTMVVTDPIIVSLRPIDMGTCPTMVDRNLNKCGYTHIMAGTNPIQVVTNPIVGLGHSLCCVHTQSL